MNSLQDIDAEKQRDFAYNKIFYCLDVNSNQPELLTSDSLGTHHNGNSPIRWNDSWMIQGEVYGYPSLFGTMSGHGLPTTSMFGWEKQPIFSGLELRTNAAGQMWEDVTRPSFRASSRTVSPRESSVEYGGRGIGNEDITIEIPPTLLHHGQHQKGTSKLNQELTPSSTFENLSAKEESLNGSTASIGSHQQQYPFVPPHRSSASGGIADSSQQSNPASPSIMASVESTMSEESGSRSLVGNLPDVGDRQSDYQELVVPRPDNIRSDGRTYTCTYHGCTKRFETPQKLKRHKMEGHQKGTPRNPRLTQAGPHTCKRTHPQTGKPCNSTFSRPYDLTRHEATIHDAKKQKLRCKICTEEKTFSRNDALTKHMKAVHSGIGFPGKTKR